MKKIEERFCCCCFSFVGRRDDSNRGRHDSVEHRRVGAGGSRLGAARVGAGGERVGVLLDARDLGGGVVELAVERRIDGREQVVGADDEVKVHLVELVERRLALLLERETVAGGQRGALDKLILGRLDVDVDGSRLVLLVGSRVAVVVGVFGLLADGLVLAGISALQIDVDVVLRRSSTEKDEKK